MSPRIVLFFKFGLVSCYPTVQVFSSPKHYSRRLKKVVMSPRWDCVGLTTYIDIYIIGTYNIYIPLESVLMQHCLLKIVHLVLACQLPKTHALQQTVCHCMHTPGQPATGTSRRGNAWLRLRAMRTPGSPVCTTTAVVTHTAVVT